MLGGLADFVAVIAGGDDQDFEPLVWVVNQPPDEASCVAFREFRNSTDEFLDQMLVRYLQQVLASEIAAQKYCAREQGHQ
jgi:hypothetical protein